MSYLGHHPQHDALQTHSIGALYPLAVVGRGNGNVTTYEVHNLLTGQVLKHTLTCTAAYHEAVRLRNYL